MVTLVTLCVFGKIGSQGHVGDVVCVSVNYCFGVTGSRGSRGYIVFFIIRNIGDRDTKLGHVCDPGDYRSQRHKIGSRL